MAYASAIVIAGALIAGAILYTNANPGAKTRISPQPSPKISIRPVNTADHIRGNINAKAIVVEFSDLECPFCKRFHPTMKQILNDYRGEVAWVYRHFPLDQLHPKARREAEAAECASGLGGNDKFWAYIDRVFEITPSNNGLDPALLPQIASDIGLDRKEFESCLASGKYASLVSADVDDAVNAGAGGTPYSVILDRTGKIINVIPGALPYEQVKSLISTAIQ